MACQRLATAVVVVQDQSGLQGEMRQQSNDCHMPENFEKVADD